MPLPHLKWQWMSHLSASVPLLGPSSHCSPGSIFPLPQLAVGTKDLQSVVQEPGMPVFMPSSHCSPNWPSTALSPQ